MRRRPERLDPTLPSPLVLPRPPLRSRLNLANCPEKLRLEGWETRAPTCPWCDDGSAERIHASTHRLCGSFSSAASSTGSSSSSSPTSPELGATRAHRSGSGASTLSSLPRYGTSASAESERGQRSRDMNDRLHLYLTTSHQDVLPSARKNAPSYTCAPAPLDDSPTSDGASVRSAGVRFGNPWKKSVKFSRGFFTG